MPDYLFIPLEVFVIAFIISMMMAFMIKGMLYVIRRFSKDQPNSDEE